MKIDTCIIGAGIAGLVAANALANKNRSVVVLDKGRGVGGRMSLRRFGNSLFDHGAQFFSVKDDRFAGMVEQWQHLGLVKLWSKGFEASNGKNENRKQPYYCGISGMNAIAKHLAKCVNVRLGTRVAGISYDRGSWQVVSDKGEDLLAHSLIMTPPVPQTLEILNSAGFQMPPGDYDVLNRIKYEPCIALLAILKGRSNLPDAGGLFGAGEPIQWIADNTKKGIASGPTSLTIHAGPKWSLQHWQTDDTDIKNLLVEAAGAWLGSEVEQCQVHRWRYSRPVEIYPGTCYLIDAPAPLILAGDAFGGPRVEGAALSGLAAAEKIKQIN